MELKRLINQFAYRIASKPDGGFIARAIDPSVAPIEAPTREELQKRIQQTVLAGLSGEFPELKLPADGTPSQPAFHIERTPEGGFSIHSADPNTDVVHATNENDLQCRLLEKLANVAGRHLAPQLAQALAAQGTSGDINVSLSQKSAITVQPLTHKVSLRLSASLPPTGVTGTDAKFTPNDEAGALGGMTDNSPITPEPSNTGKIFRFLLVFLLVAAMVYFLFYRR